VLPAALYEVDGLVAFDLVDHFGLNTSVCHKRRANVVANHQNFVELNSFASFRSDFLDTQYIARFDSVLFATGFENRKHIVFLFNRVSGVPYS
jgi:hypothetical protein